MSQKILFGSALFLFIAVFSFFALRTEVIRFLPKQTSIPCQRCNIVMVIVDTLRADELPCYGYVRDTAPNICRFANKNVQFMNSYAQSSWTLPNVVSIFTSLYPSSHRDLVPFSVLDPKILTLPQELKSQGYKTVFIGPVDHSHIPLSKGLGKGFDEIKDYTSPDDLLLLETELNDNIAKGIPTFAVVYLFNDTHFTWTDLISGKEDNSLLWTTSLRPFNLYNQARIFTPHLWSYIKSNLSFRLEIKKQNDDLVADQNLLNELTNAKSLTEAKQIFESRPASFKESFYEMEGLSLIDPTNKDQVDYLRAVYDNHILRLDQNLGPFLTYLESPQLSAKSIVVFTGVHGEEFGEHGQINHSANLYNPSTYVPLIFSFPTVKPQKIDSLVQSIDIFHTTLAIAGFAQPRILSGIDLTDTMLGRSNAPKNTYLISQLDPNLLDKNDFTSIRNLRWKLYVNEESPHPIELYDLQEDPDEQNNLAQKYPETVKKLIGEQSNILKKLPVFLYGDQVPYPTDSELRKRLIGKGSF